MAAMLWVVQGRGLALEIGTGIGVYMLALLPLGYWNSTDFRAIKQLFAR